jgi:hypothetical protein
VAQMEALRRRPELLAAALEEMGVRQDGGPP